MRDVFGFMVFHGAVPMAQSVEGYPLDSWILKFLGDSVSLPHEAFSHSSEVDCEDIRFLWANNSAWL